MQWHTDQRHLEMRRLPHYLTDVNLLVRDYPGLSIKGSQEDNIEVLLRTRFRSLPNEGSQGKKGVLAAAKREDLGSLGVLGGGKA